MTSPTQSLLRRCEKGDRKAQFELYQRCYVPLMSVCRRYRKIEQDAAAVLNEGFLRILDNIGKYHQEIPFEAWSKRIMINVLIDDFRKNRKRTDSIVHTDFDDYHPEVAVVDFNLAEEHLNAEDLQMMIDRLPPVSAKVFNLFVIDGFPHKEIAGMLGMSEGTSKWHLNSARKRLMIMLKELSEPVKKVKNG